MRSDSIQCAGGIELREDSTHAETLSAHQFNLPPTPAHIESLIRAATEKIKPHEASFRVKMEHKLWAGMYARTARIAAGMAFTSVLIKIPTLLVVQGSCYVLSGEEWHSVCGYSVIPASANRIQAYVTIEETEITMIFPTNAKTIEEAEREFTDEPDALLSRRSA